jgi:uncharacterized membrane protein
MWVNHHGLFKHIRRSTRAVRFANGLLLLCVTFVNFPTAVLARYLRENSANVAVAFYTGTYVFVALSYTLLFYAAFPHMRDRQAAGEYPLLRRVRTAYLLGLVVYLTATFVAVFAPYVGLAICSALWVLWLALRYEPKHTPDSG